MASLGSPAAPVAGVLALVLGLALTFVLASRPDEPAPVPEVVVTGGTPTVESTTKPDTDTVSPVQPPPPAPGGSRDDDGDDDDDDGDDDDE